MNITVTFNAESEKEIYKLLDALGRSFGVMPADTAMALIQAPTQTQSAPAAKGQLVNGPAEPAAKAPAKRGRPAKAAAPPPKPEPEEDEEEGEEDDGEMEDDEEDELSLQDVVSHLTTIYQSGGDAIKKAIIAFRQEQGVKLLRELTEKQLPAARKFLAELQGA